MLFSRLKNISMALAALLLVSGCATSQKMSGEDRDKIKTVQISPSVDKGQVFLLAPGGAAVGLMFGAVGGLASSGSIQDSQTAFVDYLKRNNIAIERLVQEEFDSALRASGKLAVAATADPSLPTIKLSIPQYGFGVTHLLSSNVVPVLQLKGEMVDASGKVIWNATDRMLPSIASPMDAKPWSELVADPKQVESQLRKAAAFLSKKLVQEL